MVKVCFINFTVVFVEMRDLVVMDSREVGVLMLMNVNRNIRWNGFNLSLLVGVGIFC